MIMSKNNLNKIGMSLITKDNELIRSVNYKTDNGTLDMLDSEIEKKAKESIPILSTYENRIINYLLCQARMSNQVFQKYEFTFSQFCKELNVTKGTQQYKMIMDAVISLGCKSFWWKNKNSEYTVKRWLSSETSADFENKKLKLQLDESIREVVFGLTSDYTAFLYGFIAAFNNKYAFKMYEYLRSYLNLGIITISVEKFAKDVAGNRYTTNHKLRTKVIDPAIKEINKKSDMTVYVSEVKDCKDNTTHYRFSLHDKKLSDKKNLVATWGIDRTELAKGTYDKYLDNPRWEKCMVQDERGHYEIKNCLMSKERYDAKHKEEIKQLAGEELTRKKKEIQEKYMQELYAAGIRDGWQNDLDLPF